MGVVIYNLAVKDHHSKRFNSKKLEPDVHPNRFRTLQDWLELNHEVQVLQSNALNLPATLVWLQGLLEQHC